MAESIRTDGEKGSRLETVSFIALCAVIADCAVTGGGRWLALGPVTFRMLLGCAAFVCALPAMMKRTRGWLKNPMAISLALFAVYIAVCAVRGAAAGNRTEVLLSDIKGFAWLVLASTALAVVNSRRRLETLMKCVVYASAAQAVFIIALNVSFTCGFLSVPETGMLMQQLKLGFADGITDTMYRIFMSSGPYLAAGCVFALYFQLRRKRFSWVFPVLTGVNICGLLLTFTRSLYGAAAAALCISTVLFIIFAPHLWKRLLAHTTVSAAIALALVFAQQAVSGSDYLRFAVARTLSLDIVSEQQMNDPSALSGESGKKLKQEQEYIMRTKQSDGGVRAQTLNELGKMISRNPVFGNGLGAAVQCREDGLNEYFYQDKLAKTGAFGLALYLFPVAYMAYALARRGSKRLGGKLVRASWFSALCAFLFATYFNPYMNASLGIACYSIAVACFSLREKDYGAA